MGETMTQLKTAALSLAVLGLCGYLISLGAVDYVCRPYKPVEECAPGIYEIKIYESTFTRVDPLAFLEVSCIYDIGQRYKAADVWFHTPPARTEFIEFVELPKKHIEICKVD